MHLKQMLACRALRFDYLILLAYQCTKLHDGHFYSKIKLILNLYLFFSLHCGHFEIPIKTHQNTYCKNGTNIFLYQYTPDHLKIIKHKLEVSVYHVNTQEGPPSHFSNKSSKLIKILPDHQIVHVIIKVLF